MRFDYCMYMHVHIGIKREALIHYTDILVHLGMTASHIHKCMPTEGEHSLEIQEWHMQINTEIL